VAYASCSIVLLSVLKKKKFTSIRARKFRGLENLIRILVLIGVAFRLFANSREGDMEGM
jgi:hypothetical protein